MASLEAELQDYLRAHNVESLLKDLVIKLCVDKPDDVLSYIQKHIAKLQEEQEEDDEPRAPAARKPSRRGAVSADVVNADDAENYQKKVSFHTFLSIHFFFFMKSLFLICLHRLDISLLLC